MLVTARPLLLLTYSLVISPGQYLDLALSIQAIYNRGQMLMQFFVCSLRLVRKQGMRYL